ncbi:Abortive infection bacteriophage resistance protein [hydrothermal vent metagenome]|uniref:Abortive infection bacteriophage resistance protein n=1 Tax=hydrothermal vent metagenome TaxID=652676 RepID=A0A1W1BEU6_9ZZZZ
MKAFQKPPLTLQKQLQQLQERYQVKIKDTQKALLYLQHCNYYRLRGYWLYFEQKGLDADFDAIINLYEFDKSLRDLLLSNIERVETSIKSSFAYHLTITYNNAHIHCDPSLFNNKRYYSESIKKLTEAFKNSNETYALHFKDNYYESIPPLWVNVELMTFGEISKWIRNLNIKDTKEIAKSYNLKSAKVFTSILYHLTEVRNRAAHHARVWNISFKNRFEIPKKYKTILSQEKFLLSHTLIVLKDLLDIIYPQHTLINNFFALVQKYKIPLQEMGVDRTIENRLYIATSLI